LLEAYYDGEVPVDQAIRSCEQELQGRPGDWMVEACALACSSGLHAMRGDFDHARELVARSLAIADEFNVLNVYPTFERRDIEMLAGDFAAAERWLRAAAKNVFRLQHWWGLGFEIQASIAVALCHQGRYEEAARLTALMPAQVGDNAWGHVFWRCGRARALARVGSPDEAIVLANEAIEMADQTDSPNLRGDALLDRADVLRVCGNDEDAARDIDAALALYERKGNLVMAERARLFAASVTA